MSKSILALLVALPLGGCLTPAQEPPKSQPDRDPNTVITRSGPAVVQAARTTLLEDNERLRDLLNQALADKRDLEQRLVVAEERGKELDRQLVDREDAIAHLSEQIAGLEARLEASEGARARLEGERKTLAEMYAVEKRQRLAFEKELLEREIADRTHAQGGS